MSTDVQVVLDACVLAPMPLADTLFRLAETPRLYSPRWSDDILAEVASTLTGKLGLSIEQARYRESELRKHFPENIDLGVDELLVRLRAVVPGFASHLLSELRLDAPP